MEVINELLTAIRELTELVASRDKLSYLQQASCMADRCAKEVNLDYLKWMLSYGWNLGV